MLHDPEEYPQPDLFKPERFIKDGKINPNVRDPSTIIFGFGRRYAMCTHPPRVVIRSFGNRICPGRHLASASLFLTIASILHVFHVQPATDEDGRPMDIDVEVGTALVS